MERPGEAMERPPIAALAIIVHPRFAPPEAAPPAPRPLQLRDLPREVTTLIAHGLDARDLCALALTCRDAAALAGDARLWRRLAVRAFRASPDAAPRCWRELYRYNHVLARRMFREVARPVLGGRGPPGPLVPHPLLFAQ